MSRALVGLSTIPSGFIYIDSNSNTMGFHYYRLRLNSIYLFGFEFISVLHRAIQTDILDSLEKKNTLLRKLRQEQKSSKNEEEQPYYMNQ